MFGLDPENIVARVKASGQTPRVLTLRESVLRGALGFTVVSLGGFAPWVLGGSWFYRNIGEGGLYAVCALVFVGLSGWLLHRLIIGPGALVRFYQLFSLAFMVYAVAWTASWMALGGVAGGVVGLLTGTAAMGAIFAVGFRAGNQSLLIIAILFLTNATGYFAGEWAHNALAALPENQPFDRRTRNVLAKAAWGLFYGVGFGAGIGFAFHTCQTRVRKLLAGLP